MPIIAASSKSLHISIIIKQFLSRDALIVAFTNCATSVFAAIIIFAIMGFKAHNAYEACLRDTELNGNSTQTVCNLQVR